MAPGREIEIWRTKDGRAWRIGLDAEIAWIRENTERGLGITSAIPPVFDAYATLELPGTGEHDPSWLEDPDRHAAGVLALLCKHTAAQTWWLGYLETGLGAETIFYDVPKVTLYSDWQYVLIEAGPEPAGSWRAYDLWKGVLPDLMFPTDRSIGDAQFVEQPVEARTQILHAIANSSPEAKLGVRQLRALTLLFFYALPDAAGRNPNWEALGYPGPISAPPTPDQAPKTINIERITGAAVTLETDVCVIGSGAGGGVIAAELQRSGRQTLVLEQGQYRNESDFKQLELPGMLELYLGGGLAGSEDGSIAILAGSTLGGGTVVNYMNCIRTPERIRREWASMGVVGLDSPDYDRHIDAIWERLSVNDTATSHNRTHRKLIAGCERLGYRHRALMRNADPSCDDPRVCGYCATGCQKGCKQSTLKTFLQDASDAGARVVVGARAERVLVQDGRAAGVEATVTQGDGSTTAVTVHAGTVVIACGAIESPALLLRSGIGGPAVGKHLRVHPVGVVTGIYQEPIEGWIGQIQSALSDQFSACDGEHGFLIEGLGVSPGMFAAASPWTDGYSHEERMARTLKHAAPFISVVRDHGEGEVVIDEHGRAVTRWGFDDEVDERLFRKAMVEQATLHRMAGAKEIATLYQEPVIWRDGEDFDAFLTTIERASLAPNDMLALSAHQMGSCRLGIDPGTSVADGRGELHDTKGVWIGDGSAFPTAPGVNPMISIMSLAHRTAENMIAAS